MARMIPEKVPDLLRIKPGREAEIDVYHSLSDTLDDTYSVFAWTRWTFRDVKSGAKARTGEADFIVAHPDQGFLVLEVKGGRVEYDATAGAWFSTDRHEERHEIDDPVAQASQSAHLLLHKLKESPPWADRFAPMGYGAVFPSGDLPAGDLGFSHPREILLDRHALFTADRSIPRVFDYFNAQGRSPAGFGPEGVRALERVIGNSFRIEPVFGASIDAAANEVRRIELTHAQYDVLAMLRANRRALVTGGPGTGKTILAYEKARRLAQDEGFRVLLTCFNRPLAAELKRQAQGIDGLWVAGFHEFCGALAKKAGIGNDPGIPRETGAGAEAQWDVYRRELPHKLLKALDRLPEERFDAIVVDEGQDFGPDMREALELSLKDRKDAVFYVFQDADQEVYKDGGGWSADDDLVPFELPVSLRYTRQIHEAVSRLSGHAVGTPPTTEGPAPLLIPAETPALERRELSKALHRLIKEDSIRPDRIAVLMSSREVIQEVAPGLELPSCRLTQEHVAGDDRVLVESITRFKGLERDVVILVGIRDVDYVNFRPLLCVGASRARAHLIVIGSGELLRQFRGDG